MAIPLAKKPITIEIRPPYNKRASKSRPKASVPKKCFKDGD